MQGDLSKDARRKKRNDEKQCERNENCIDIRSIYDVDDCSYSITNNRVSD